METCLTSCNTNLQITQIIDDDTYATYSSIHTHTSIYSIEVEYKKVISVNALLTNNAIISRDGQPIYQSDQAIINVTQIKHIFYIQFQDKLVSFNINTQEELIIFQGLIFDVVIEIPKIIIESNFYYIYDTKSKNLIRVGKTEKNKQFGCACYQSYLFCSRPLGVIWRALIDTGEVLNSYRFEGLKKVGQLHCLQDYLFIENQNQFHIISLKDMSIFKVIQLDYNAIYYSSNLIRFYKKSKLYTIQILPIQQVLDKYMEQSNEEAIEIFKKYESLQTFENAIKLAKSIDCHQIQQLINQALKRPIPQIIQQNTHTLSIKLQQKQIEMKNSIKVIQWIQNQKVIIAKNNNPYLEQHIKYVKSRLQEINSFKRIEKVLNKSMKDLYHLDINMLHLMIINNLKILKKIGLQQIQVLMNLKVKRNIIKEANLFYDVTILCINNYKEDQLNRLQKIRQIYHFDLNTFINSNQVSKLIGKLYQPNDYYLLHKQYNNI